MIKNIKLTNRNRNRKEKEDCSETSTFAVTLDWPGIPNSSSSSSSLSSIRFTYSFEFCNSEQYKKVRKKNHAQACTCRNR
jgi:hypothetical protein